MSPQTGPRRAAPEPGRRPVPAPADEPSGSGTSPALPTALRAAALLIAVQAVALIALAVLLVVKTVVSHPAVVWSGLLEAAFALLGAVIFFFGARGIARLRPGARTPLVVIELLCLPVGYSLGIQAHVVAVGVPILVVALVVLYLLFTPRARQALNREF